MMSSRSTRVCVISPWLAAKLLSTTPAVRPGPRWRRVGSSFRPTFKRKTGDWSHLVVNCWRSVSRFFLSVLVFNIINSNDWVQNFSQCSSSFKIWWWWITQLALVLNLLYNFETPFCPTMDLIFTFKYKEFWKCYILNHLWQISQLHLYTKSCMLTKFTFEKVESVIVCY